MSLISSDLMREIDAALSRNETPSLVEKSDHTFKIHSLGRLKKMWHLRDPKVYQKAIAKLTAVVVKIVALKERLSIKEAAVDETLISARRFLKKLHPKIITSEALALKKELTAAKLGISSKVFDRNKEFQQFAESYHLERYLIEYGDHLRVNPVNQEISLKMDQVYRPWSQIFIEHFKKLGSPCSPRSNIKYTFSQPWLYGLNGIQHEDMFKWSELKPFKIGNPAEWKDSYVFEFCSCFNPRSIKNGNHAWVRLKTPSGEVYSVGLYRPEKADLSENFKSPLRVKPGCLMQPDISEFWDFPIFTVDFAIDRTTFLKIKETIEEDKKKDELVFQLFDHNCFLYAKKLGRIAGVELPSMTNAGYILLPPSIGNRISNWSKQLPLFVQKISFFITVFFFNVVQWMLGASAIDKELNEKQKKYAIPHLNSIKDLFDQSKVYFHHPNTLAFEIRQQVSKWRQKELSNLYKIEENKNNVNNMKKARENEILLSLPPSYYLFC